VAEPVAAEVRDDQLVAYVDGVRVIDLIGSPGEIPQATGSAFPLQDATFLAPVPEPRVLYGVGLNYAAHAAEQGLEPPAQPIIFTMQPGSVAAPGADVVCPAVVKRLDYEGELAIIIGAGGGIAGYAVADDVSARDLQKRERQWTRAKGFDGACPYGPWITTADEVADPCSLRLRTWVNDELRQDSSTADMVFSPQQIVDFVSETCTLHPGDVILSGTPGGVGMSMDPPQFLTSGDVVRIEIESLGSITHAVA
jgi:2-keto-4-pentenoate hydratase/2-oxohepta-3-ene-1,7-dioic acid hydratase in catechol pathway